MARFGNIELGLLGALLGCIAGLAVVVGTASKAHAELRAYEGFDYAVDANLIGLDGGIGFDGAWGMVLVQAAGVSDVIAEDSLTYTDINGSTLDTSGNKLLNSGAGGTGFTGRMLSFRRDDTTATQSWFSMLGIRLGATPVRGANFTLFDTTHAATAGGADGAAEKLNIGENSNQSFDLGDGTTEDRWQIRAPQVTANPWPAGGEPPTASPAGGNVETVFTEVLFTELAFFVARIDHVDGGEDVVHFWLNPVLGETPLDEDASGYYLPDQIIAAAGGMGGYDNPPNGSEFSFDLFRLFAGNDQGAGPGEWHIDELRVGDTFQDVAPNDGNPIIPGDVDGDTDVDEDDFGIIRDHMFQSVTMRTEGDLNSDGIVNFADFRSWKNNFPTDPLPMGQGAGNIPEPATALLVLLGCLIAVGCQRQSPASGAGAHRSR